MRTKRVPALEGLLGGLEGLVGSSGNPSLLLRGELGTGGSKSKSNSKSKGGKGRLESI